MVVQKFLYECCSIKFCATFIVKDRAMEDFDDKFLNLSVHPLKFNLLYLLHLQNVTTFSPFLIKYHSMPRCTSQIALKCSIKFSSCSLLISAEKLNWNFVRLPLVVHFHFFTSHFFSSRT